MVVIVSRPKTAAPGLSESPNRWQIQMQVPKTNMGEFAAKKIKTGEKLAG